MIHKCTRTQVGNTLCHSVSRLGAVVAGQRYSLSLVVGQRDPLRGHFEVDDSRLGWLSSSSDRVRYGFGHRLRSGQTLHVCRVDVQHIAGCNRTVVIWSVRTN